jgi:hypothetical protein
VSGPGTTDTEIPQHSGTQKSAGSKRGSDPKSARPGDLKSEKSGGSASNPEANGLTPREIPDGNDDDIVARRLRKAAEQETDPELREKLWKEYVGYKKNSDTK